MAEKLTLEFNNNHLLPLLTGEHDTNLTHLESALDVTISNRGGKITVSGNSRAVHKSADILKKMWERLQKGQDVTRAEIDAALRFAEDKKMTEKKKIQDSTMTITTNRKDISPRSPNQAIYMKAIKDHNMVFGLGPAGTGKTYLAVAVGVSMYLKGDVERLIFCRPAVEAGEHLGFLPGDMKEKIDPYLRPIYDALQDMLPRDFVLKKMAEGEIEIAPLAFMRGRTLSNAFVILDEAQNTTTSQMKMFLTRMGESSRMVITGDPSQTDLQRGIESGLNDAIRTLQHIDDIYFMEFDAGDVVRHPLVSKIVKAYDGKK